MWLVVSQCSSLWVTVVLEDLASLLILSGDITQECGGKGGKDSHLCEGY